VKVGGIKRKNKRTRPMIAENMIRLLLMEHYWENYKKGDKSVIKNLDDKNKFMNRLRTLRTNFLESD
jgi:CRISPR/Cas system-associated protein Cas7 (RAMP superfamily)